MKTKQTFWDNTKGVFPISLEGEFNDLIVFAINNYFNSPEFEVNFNDAGDSFFVRTKHFAIRVSNRWGKIGNCDWQLNRDHNIGKFQLVKIVYENLQTNEQI